MRNGKMYYVYILTNENNTVLYTGVTNDLKRRLAEHRNPLSVKSFTNRYKLTKLVYYETTTDVTSAIEREKQIKAGNRQNKIRLIERMNPNWDDLG